MKCPHCNVTVKPNWDFEVIPIRAIIANSQGWGAEYAECPNCEEPIIKIGYYKYERLPNGDVAGDLINNEYIVWPRHENHAALGEGVPESLKNDYQEAREVLPISPKASAALSRRILQSILESQGYSQRSLASQIDAVLQETRPNKTIPSSIKNNIDAIRNFGNFSAHPITDTTTLQIIDVEQEEAEWCLVLVERLLDYYYITPAADKKKRDELAQKLRQAGKPPAKR